jgi:hypothetical protein
MLLNNLNNKKKLFKKKKKPKTAKIFKIPQFTQSQSSTNSNVIEKKKQLLRLAQYTSQALVIVKGKILWRQV